MTSAPLILVNGSPAPLLSPLDRGLAFGDGVFRTLRMEAGEPVWWPDHYAKLAADCQQLSLFNPSRSEWEQDLAWIAARQPDSVVKLTVTRGPGPRGYRPPEQPFPTRLATASPLPDFPDPIRDTGATIRVCDLRLGEQPRLAGAKHLNRLENVLARMEWDDPAIDEGVLLDGSDRVVSGVMSNLFLRRDGVWLTPALARCGVAGVARGRLMPILDAREADLGLADLIRADSVLLSNSLIRLRWVARLGERTWTRPTDFEAILEKLCSGV
jgi:4-amino-4-deoxychorismate lyase